MRNDVKNALEKMDKDEKTAKVLKYMATHKRGITPMHAVEKFYVYRLSSIIYNLRNTYHLPIESHAETTIDGTRYARYTLGEEDAAV